MVGLENKPTYDIITLVYKKYGYIGEMDIKISAY